MRSELDVLLNRVEDPALRADLQAQIDRLKQRRSFGFGIRAAHPGAGAAAAAPDPDRLPVVSRDAPIARPTRSSPLRTD